MKLQNIKTESCPCCGTTLISFETIEADGNHFRVHCNSERWESRTFVCGYSICYVPNFEREEQRGECTQCPEYAAKMTKRQVAKQALIEFCDGLAVDNEYKAILKRWID